MRERIKSGWTYLFFWNKCKTKHDILISFVEIHLTCVTQTDISLLFVSSTIIPLTDWKNVSSSDG